jgi:hypothetical protein
MREKDFVKKEWLKNWVNIELTQLIRSDRDAVRNQMDVYGDAVTKLEKVLLKLHEQKISQDTRIEEDFDRENQILQSENKAYIHEKQDIEQELQRLDNDTKQFTDEIARK